MRLPIGYSMYHKGALVHPARRSKKPCAFLGGPMLVSPWYENWIRGRRRNGEWILATQFKRKLGSSHYSEPPNPIILVAACDLLIQFMDESWQKWECVVLTCRNTNGDSLLHMAAKFGNSAMVKRLLEYDTIETVLNTGTPLFAVDGGRDTEIVQQLLAHNTIDVNLKSPLFLGAGRGHTEIVQQLLAYNAIDVNMEGEVDSCYDRSRSTPLFKAAYARYREIV